MEGKLRERLNRRRFLLGCALSGGGIVAADLLSKSGKAQVSAPAIVISDQMRPQIPFGVASGDITGNSAVVWSRCDRPGRMIVEYSTYRVIPECAAGRGTSRPEVHWGMVVSGKT
ncbi:hypothetical protein [Coleofasciculus sp. H7-2]|uniref:hypothetical protein n=1 Tax=Coleofasciculus sp. H7-2 TaxID=3351545 RepID=UPI00366F7FAA